MNKKNAVIYARYSSHKQNDVSIEQQVAECRDYAENEGYQVIRVYADHAVSGTTDNRPQFQQMIHDAERKDFTAVICWKLDRFARNRYDSATYKYRLKKHGVKVVYAKESIPDTPEGILLESILEGSAEYYSANLSQNIKRGMQYNAEQCLFNGGHIPMGYHIGEDRKYHIYEPEADVVRWIFRQVADGVSYVDISNELNSRGIRTSKGKLWSRSSYCTLLRNEAYIGVYKSCEKRVENGIPAIVDRQIFEEVQKKLEKKQEVRGRHTGNEDYMLTGKLRCGLCNAYMTGFCGTSRNGERHYYYGCRTRREGSGCKKEYIRKDRIEQIVVDLTLKYVLQPDMIERIADAVVAFQEREAAESSQLHYLKDRLADTQRAHANMLKAIEAGIITESTKKRLMELEAEISDLKMSLRVEEASHPHFKREDIVLWLSSFRNGSTKDKRFCQKVIDTFISVIYVYDDHIKIGFNYSGSCNEADFQLVKDSTPPTEEECLLKLQDSPPIWNQANTVIYLIDSMIVLAATIQ